MIKKTFTDWVVVILLLCFGRDFLGTDLSLHPTSTVVFCDATYNTHIQASCTTFSYTHEITKEVKLRRRKCLFFIWYWENVLLDFIVFLVYSWFNLALLAFFCYWKNWKHGICFIVCSFSRSCFIVGLEAKAYHMMFDVMIFRCYCLILCTNCW